LIYQNKVSGECWVMEGRAYQVFEILFRGIEWVELCTLLAKQNHRIELQYLIHPLAGDQGFCQ
jgi:hypothetical protein